MQYGVYVNQVKALEWDLSIQQAMLYAVIYEAQHWADSLVVAGKTYYNLSKGKIIQELPLLTDKKDTVYRLVRQLEKNGVLVCSRINGKDYFMITDRGRTWNRQPSRSPEAVTPQNPAVNECGGEPSVQIPLDCVGNSEKNPSFQYEQEKNLIEQGLDSTEQANSEKNPTVGTSSICRKKIRQISEKNPANLGKKSDELYNQDNNNQDQRRRATARDAEFLMHWSWEPLSNFGERLQRSGISIDQIPYDNFIQIVGEFVSYWIGRDDTFHSNQWDHKLFQRFIREHRKGTLYATNTCKKSVAGHGQIDWDNTDWINDLNLCGEPA